MDLGDSSNAKRECRAVLSKMLGHTDESTARFYYEVRSDRVRRVAKSLKLHVAEVG
ncbi:MAG: hypothetical protein ACE5I3_11305 [Phycisphaerae bacterium]